MHDGLALHRGREYNRGTGYGKTVRPGLHGGCRVTGIPTVEASVMQSRPSKYYNLQKNEDWGERQPKTEGIT
jgi:hypothetical protein